LTVPDQERHALLEADLRALTRELDAELGDLDLSAAVTRELEARQAPVQQLVRPRRRRLAVALVVSIVIAATAAIPSARAAVTNFLDIGVVRVHREPPPGPVSPTTDLQLGERTTLADARAQVSVVVPAATGFRTPEEVWFTPVGGGGVSLVYRARPGLPAAEHTGVGLLVQEFAGETQTSVNKFLTAGVRAEQVTINSDRGVFISGGEHTIFYNATDGTQIQTSGRLVGNALIFQRGPLTIRLEGDLSRDRMVAIAESLA
jgi:hypothetical protein